MLHTSDAIATIPVKKLDAAREFYEATLGFVPIVRNEPGVVSYKSGASEILVYESRYAGTNEATAVTWNVDDVEQEVESLRSKGVSFEHYDLPGVRREGDIHHAGKLKNAWFKDPDGNILSIVGS